MKSLTDLATETHAPVEALKAWATAPAPEGIDPQMWADAQRTRVARARRWQEQELGRLPHYMHGVLPKATPIPIPVEIDTSQAA